jgi:hypothetical protein
MDLNPRIEVYEPPAVLRVVTRAYATLLLVAFALLPAYLVAFRYL